MSNLQLKAWLTANARYTVLVKKTALEYPLMNPLKHMNFQCFLVIVYCVDLESFDKHTLRPTTAYYAPYREWSITNMLNRLVHHVMVPTKWCST